MEPTQPQLPPQPIQRPPVACPSCHAIVSETYYFCQNCGKKLKAAPLSTAIGKQLGIYFLSFFLPPLGLVPGVQYLMQKDPKAKAIGAAAIILTIISVAVTGYYLMEFLNQYNKLLGPLGY